jgi:hypothetical protein
MIPFTVYDPTTGKVLGRGRAPNEWQETTPGRKILWGVAATRDQRVDPITLQVVSRLPLGVPGNASVAAGVPLPLTVPIPVSVYYDAIFVGTLNAGGDTIAFPDPGVHVVRLVDEDAGLYLPATINVTVT